MFLLAHSYPNYKLLYTTLKWNQNNMISEGSVFDIVKSAANPHKAAIIIRIFIDISAGRMLGPIDKCCNLYQ